MQNLFESLLFSSSVLTVLFAIVVAAVVTFNYHLEVKRQVVSEILFVDENAEISMFKGVFCILFLMIFFTLLIFEVKQLHFDNAMFATNWWLAILDLILINFFGWLSHWSSWKVDLRYWIIATASVVLQLAFTIDFFAFLFM